jgi:protein disulfide-isomerase-like protein
MITNYSILGNYLGFHVIDKEKFQPRIEELTTQSFYTIYNQPTLLFMYAPWCHHCKQFAPIYQQLANTCTENILFASVDCEAHSGFIEEFGIRGFPTILLFTKNKEFEMYNGNRTLADILQWITEKMSLI